MAFPVVDAEMSAAGSVLVREGTKILRKEGPVILGSILGSSRKGR